MSIIRRSPFKLETSEASATRNWVQRELKESGFGLIEFEGYTIRKGTVSALFDRASVTDADFPMSATVTEIAVRLASSVADIGARIDFARHVRVPYHFVLYRKTADGFSFITLPVVIPDAACCPELAPVLHGDAKGFAEWMGGFRDLSMTKGYGLHNDAAAALPDIDRFLRGINAPWPGNLDGILVNHVTGRPAAIIEFQSTNRICVRDHSNNAFFGQDRKRWQVVDIVRKLVGVPLLVLVWSASEKAVKVKIVSGIADDGIFYSFVDVVPMDRLCELLFAVLGSGVNPLGIQREPSGDERPPDAASVPPPRVMAAAKVPVVSPSGMHRSLFGRSRVPMPKPVPPGV